MQTITYGDLAAFVNVYSTMKLPKKSVKIP